MRHPRREPRASDDSHLPAHVQPRGDWVLVVHGICCWEEPNGDFWRIDMVDGVAVTWCNSPCMEVPF